MKIYNVDDYHIKSLNTEQFTKWCELQAQSQGCEFDPSMTQEAYALTCLSDALPIPVILLHKDKFDNLPKDWKIIIISHEIAHCEGIEAEEDADRWALGCLNEIQQEMLIDLWEHRHGHPYEGKYNDSKN